MAATCKLAILSDIHYAAAAERARGGDYELRGITNPLLRLLARTFRHYLWLREPLEKYYLVDRFLAQPDCFDHVVANGDYSCDSGYLGASDDVVWESIQECLGKLRGKFGDRFHAIYGDHDLGKLSFFGGRGGIRLASWKRLQDEPSLRAFWKLEIGNYVLLGIVSSLVALPVFEPDALPEEWPEWERLRKMHLDLIRQAFAALKPHQRVLLFCHDPTALPFLWREEAVRARLSQLEHTVIGHLHSGLVLWKSRHLAGLPRIGFLGHTVRRYSAALSEGRYWRPFNVKLCPALAGIQLLKDGGYLTVDLDLEGRGAAQFKFHPLPLGHA